MRALRGLLFCGWLIGTPISSADDLDTLLQRGSVDRPAAAPGPKLDYLFERGLEGFHEIMDFYFPQTAPEVEPDLTAAEVEALVKDLSHESFKVRRAATKKLKEKGYPHRALLETMKDVRDPEVKFRIRSLLDGFSEQSDKELAAEPVLNLDEYKAWLTRLN
ncbi:MAG: hypothetical protein AAF492_20675, partial [Verrucomicrobiota bacterium]